MIDWPARPRRQAAADRAGYHALIIGQQKTSAFAEVKRLSVKKSRGKRNRSKIIAIDYSATLQAYLP